MERCSDSAALASCDGVDRTAVAGDVAGAQAELVGELHQRVLDLDVALFGLHRAAAWSV